MHAKQGEQQKGMSSIVPEVLSNSRRSSALRRIPLKTSSIVLLFGCVWFPLSVFSFLFIALNLPNAPAPFVHHHQVHKSWHSVCPPHSWWESKPKKINKHSWLRTGIWNLHWNHHLPQKLAVTFEGWHCCIFVHVNIPSKPMAFDKLCRFKSMVPNLGFW